MPQCCHQFYIWAYPIIELVAAFAVFNAKKMIKEGYFWMLWLTKTKSKLEQTIWHSEGIPEGNLWKGWFLKKKSADDKNSGSISQHAKI